MFIPVGEGSQGAYILNPLSRALGLMDRYMAGRQVSGRGRDQDKAVWSDGELLT